MPEKQSPFPALELFAPVGLKELDAVKLMNRVDQKFILHESELNALLQELNPYYRVLEIDGKRLFQYSSLYYDTSNFGFYHDHHNGKPNRVKIRSRDYVDTGTSFFEVKLKIKGVRTEKYRVKHSGALQQPDSPENELLKKHNLDHLQLVPSVLIKYSRITLAGIELSERVTIDTALNFEFNNGEEAMNGLVIIEVKQDQVKRESPVIQALRKRQNRPFGISKYALGMVMMNAVKKTNAFRHKVSKINQLILKHGTQRRH